MKHKYVARYASYGHEIIKAEDDETAAWIALHWARMRGAKLVDVEPITYKDFFNWKVMGWVLPSSIACVIREEKDGKISEKIYSQSQSARNYLEKQMSNKDTNTIFTIADEHSVQVLYPKGNHKTYKQLPKDEKSHRQSGKHGRKQSN